jgi:hypothetical protein
MAALPGDIGAALRDSSPAIWSDATIAIRYPSARDGSITPAVGYFDNAADAQAMADARGALIGTERRRFSVKAEDLAWPTVEAGVPQVQLIDAEQVVSAVHLVARIELDLENETSTFELFG